MILSIVIPTYQRNDLLTKCLEALSYQNQQLSASDYEIIVSDDGKVNHNAEQLIASKFPWVKWVKGPQKGPAANRNNGASVSEGKWIAFIDDDCIPEENIVVAYLKAIHDYPDILAFEGRIFVNDEPKTLLDEAPLNESGGCFWSCNICIESSLFKKLKGFDEDFPYAAMEDIDFFYRLKKVTDKHKFIYEAAVMHPWRTNHKLSKTSYQRYKSMVYYVHKHPEQKKNLNPTSHFKHFFKSRPGTLKQAIKYKFSGFVEKFKSDLVWIYVGFKFMFDIRKTK